MTDADQPHQPDDPVPPFVVAIPADWNEMATEHKRALIRAFATEAARRARILPHPVDDARTSQD